MVALRSFSDFFTALVWALSDGARDTSTILFAILLGFIAGLSMLWFLLEPPSLRSKLQALRQ